MTLATDQRRRGGAFDSLSVFYHGDDVESEAHQRIAQLVWAARKQPGEPHWMDLPREDRSAVFSLTDGLV